MTRALVNVDAAKATTNLTPGLPAVLVEDGGTVVALAAQRPAALLLWLRDLAGQLEPHVSNVDLIAEQHRRAHGSGATWCPTCQVVAIGGARSSCGGLLHTRCDTLLTTPPAEVAA